MNLELQIIQSDHISLYFKDFFVVSFSITFENYEN